MYGIRMQMLRRLRFAMQPPVFDHGIQNDGLAVGKVFIRCEHREAEPQHLGAQGGLINLCK